MKKVLLGALLVAGSTLFAQDVPSSVMKAFESKFPKAEETEWDMNDGNYEANFYDNNLSKTARFSEKGTYVETRTILDEAPAAIEKAVKTSFDGASIDGVALIELADGSSTYEISASNDNASYTIVTDKAGKVLSSEEFINDYGDDE